MKNGYAPLVSTISFFVIAKLFSLFKLSLSAGSFWTFFSLRNIIAPLSGAFGGVSGAGLFFAGSIFSAMLFKKTVFLSSLAFSGIPTLFSSLYWATESRLVRAGVPAVCMLLFVMHAQGAGAWPYAMFWLIPIGITFFNTSSLFLTALGSTFTAHAVGSVLWLYATAMDAQHWMALIPQVALERFTYALGMYLSYRVFSYIASHSVSFVSARASSDA